MATVNFVVLGVGASPRIKKSGPLRRPLPTLRHPRTPAMAPDVDDHLWSLREIAELLD